MPTAKLSAALLKKAEPSAKPYELRDTETKGLLVRVQPTGKKTFVCEYKVNGRKTRATLGDATTLKLPAARLAAQKIISDALLKGVDHNLARRKALKDKHLAKTSSLGGFIEHLYTPHAKRYIASHEDILRRLKQNFSDLWDKNMTDISELDVERWRRKKAEAHNPVTFETLQREITYLKSVLNLAASKEFGILSHSPLLGFTLKRRKDSPERSNRPKLRYLERGIEDVRLRAALVARDDRLREERQRANEWRQRRNYPLLPEIQTFGDHISPIVLLSLNTGMDLGDIFDLEVDHIDFELRHIRKHRNKISHKGKERIWTIPLTQEAFQILKTWINEQEILSGRVFPSPVNGGRLNNIQKAWKSVVKEADLKDFRFKDLRHTFASWLAIDNISLNTIRELMCHTDIKTTLIYAHLSADHKADAVATVFDSRG